MRQNSVIVGMLSGKQTFTWASVPHSSNSISCCTSFCASVNFLLLTKLLTSFRHFACSLSNAGSFSLSVLLLVFLLVFWKKAWTLYCRTINSFQHTEKSTDTKETLCDEYWMAKWRTSYNSTEFILINMDQTPVLYNIYSSSAQAE